MNDSELLKIALEDGILDLPSIREKVNMNERMKYFNKHQEQIWQGKDGRYKTHLPNRKLVSKKSFEELRDYLASYYKEQDLSPCIDKVFTEWLERKANYGEIQKQTVLRYQSVFNKYYRNSILMEVKFKDITQVLLEDFVLKTIHDYELTAKAWGNVRIILRGIFKHAKKRGYTDISITQFLGDLELSRKIFKPRRMVDEEQVFTLEEEQALIKRAYESNRIQELAVALALQTGMRAGEIVSLKWDDVHDNYIDVNKTESRTRDENDKQIYVIRDSPKTENGFRKVYFTNDAQLTIHKMKMINPFTDYICMIGDKRMHGQLLGYTSKSMCNKIGILPRSIHKCRKTYATNLINAGVDEKLIQSQLGHSDITTTRKYYYYNNISEEEALSQLQKAVGSQVLTNFNQL